MRNGLLAGVSAAILLLLSPGLIPAVAAQEVVTRAEPSAGAVLEKVPPHVELWLKQPPSAPGDAEVRVVHDESAERVDVAGAAWDAADPGHLKVQLRRDLGPGKYVVSWIVREVDREYTGSYSFTVAESSDQGNDNLVPIALATFGAAGAAVVLGLIAYLLRVRLGLAKPPPPPDEGHGTT